MKRLQKIQPSGFYLFESRSTAKSCYFQSKNEVEGFFRIFERFVGDIIEVYDYLMMSDGWVLAVKVKKESVLDAFWEDRHGGEKSDTPHWKMVSEQVRLALSLYVRWANCGRRSTGTLVHSSYERRYFSTKRGAIDYLGKMKEEALGPKQRYKRYRSKKKYYKKLKALGKGHILLTSKAREKKSRVEIGKAGGFFKCLSDRVLTEEVLLKLVESTYAMHNPPKNTS